MREKGSDLITLRVSSLGQVQDETHDNELKVASTKDSPHVVQFKEWWIDRGKRAGEPVDIHNDVEANLVACKRISVWYTVLCICIPDM